MTARTLSTWLVGLAIVIAGTVVGCARVDCGGGCEAGTTCVDGRCRHPCSSTGDCAAGRVCYRGYCETSDPWPGPMTASDSSASDGSAGDAPSEVCGDDLRQVGEACDGPDLDDRPSCSDHWYTGDEAAACMPTCIAFDLRACTGAPPSCGSGQLQGHEQCDGADLGGLTCAALGFTGGTLGCNGNCSFDVSGCTR